MSIPRVTYRNTETIEEFAQASLKIQELSIEEHNLYASLLANQISYEEFKQKGVFDILVKAGIVISCTLH